jgi:hypothetical protein
VSAAAWVAVAASARGAVEGAAATAADVRPGDFLELRTGVVAVLMVYASHGGRECVIRPAGGGKRRALWFWPGQAVRIVARAGGTGGAGEAIAARPPRGAAGSGRAA